MITLSQTINASRLGTYCSLARIGKRLFSLARLALNINSFRHLMHFLSPTKPHRRKRNGGVRLEQLRPGIPPSWRIPKKPLSPIPNPCVAEFIVRGIAVVIFKFGSAALADVIVCGGFF